MKERPGEPMLAFAAMSRKELRLEAEELGVSPRSIDLFRDDELSKEQFIDLLLSKVPFSLPPPPLNPRDALRAMSKKELRVEAEKLGVSVADIDRFRDEEISQEEFVELMARKQLQLQLQLQPQLQTMRAGAKELARKGKAEILGRLSPCTAINLTLENALQPNQLYPLLDVCTSGQVCK